MLLLFLLIVLRETDTKELIQYKLCTKVGLIKSCLYYCKDKGNQINVMNAKDNLYGDNIIRDLVKKIERR